MKIDQQKLNEYLKTLIPHTCPLCGKGPWIASDTVFQLMEYNQNSIVIGGPVLPVLPLTCEHCGNTLFINAIIAGLVEQQKQEAENG